MKTFARLFIPQLVIGALPWCYYDLRIGFAQRFDYGISMRWIDLLVMLILAVCAAVVWRFARTIRDSDPASYATRVSLLSLLSASSFLWVVMGWGCIFVPYVPASFPVWTAGTALALTLKVAAPSVTMVVSFSFVSTLAAASLFRPTSVARPAVAA